MKQNGRLDTQYNFKWHGLSLQEMLTTFSLIHSFQHTLTNILLPAYFVLLVEIHVSPIYSVALL